MRFLARLFGIPARNRRDGRPRGWLVWLLLFVRGLLIRLVLLVVLLLLVGYGLEENLPSILTVAVLVETGPVLASLLVAGRMGAGLAAELG